MSDVIITTTEELVDLTATGETTVAVTVTEQPVELIVHEGPISWGTIVGQLSDQTDVQAALAEKANATDLTTKEDALGYTPVNKAGDTMSGNLDVGNHQLAFATLRQEDANNVNRFNLTSNGHINGGAAGFTQFDHQIRIPSMLVNTFLSLTSPAGNKAWFSQTANGGLTIQLQTAIGRSDIFFVGLANMAQMTTKGNGGQLTIGDTVDAIAQMDVLIQGATMIGAIIKAAASQAADLQQWRNSSGVALSRVDASGRFVQAKMAGTPSDTPATGTTVLDTTTNKLWVYCGAAGWKSTQLS